MLRLNWAHAQVIMIMLEELPEDICHGKSSLNCQQGIAVEPLLFLHLFKQEIAKNIN